jgi:hypothetical protein
MDGDECAVYASNYRYSSYYWYKAFDKKISPRCEYCAHGKLLDGNNEILCKKRGITMRDDFCRSYKYDPLKRNPEGVRVSKDYSAEDFSI